MKKVPFLLSIPLIGSIFMMGFVCLVAAQVQTAPNGETATQSDQPVTDTWITSKVKTELATTDGVKSTDIGVKTVDGVVTLTGVLASDIAVKKAVAAAQSVRGVKKVDSTGLKSKD
jgi:hyperosmotically inducible periplasmic protein